MTNTHVQKLIDDEIKSVKRRIDKYKKTPYEKRLNVARMYVIASLKKISKKYEKLQKEYT